MELNVITIFIIYFMAFALIHSLLASDFIKNKAQKFLGGGFRFYRLLYTLISVITFIPAFQFWLSNSANTPLVYGISHSFYPFIVIIRLEALGMFVYSAFQTDVFEFLGLRELSKKKSILITRGTYGIVRHPLYVSAILFLVTKMDMSLLDIIAVILISVYFVIGAYIEEKRLISIFGDEYRRYQERVSMFIPFKWIKDFMLKVNPAVE